MDAIKEASEYLGISKQSLRLFIQEGKFGACRMNKEKRTYLVDWDQVRAFRKERSEEI